MHLLIFYVSIVVLQLALHSKKISVLNNHHHDELIFYKFKSCHSQCTVLEDGKSVPLNEGSMYWRDARFTSLHLLSMCSNF